MGRPLGSAPRPPPEALSSLLPGVGPAQVQVDGSQKKVFPSPLSSAPPNWRQNPADEFTGC